MHPSIKGAGSYRPRTELPNTVYAQTIWTTPLRKNSAHHRTRSPSRSRIEHTVHARKTVPQSPVNVASGEEVVNSTCHAIEYREMLLEARPVNAKKPLSD